MEARLPRRRRALRIATLCGGCGQRFSTTVGANLCPTCRPTMPFDLEMARRVIEYRLAFEELEPLIARAARRGDLDAHIALELIHAVQAPGQPRRVA